MKPYTQELLTKNDIAHVRIDLFKLILQCYCMVMFEI